MDKAIFFIGLGIIILELLGVGGYFLAQQGQNVIETIVLVVVAGGINLVAVAMILMGLLAD